jgi:hypothetical protein
MRSAAGERILRPVKPVLCIFDRLMNTLEESEIAWRVDVGKFAIDVHRRPASVKYVRKKDGSHQRMAP